MVKTLLNLNFSSIINEADPHVERNHIRKLQIIKGIKRVFEYDLQSKNCDVLVSDNTCNELDSDIKAVIPDSAMIRCFNSNLYGSINKGSGLIETLERNKDIISRYDYLIYYEPRTWMKSFYFFDNFFSNPRSMFIYGDPNDKNNHTAFRTGLFSIKPSDFFEFTSIFTKDALIQNYLSIEYPIRDFMINKTDVIDKLDIIWYPASGEIYHF
jgi:hypothetical protein